MSALIEHHPRIWIAANRMSGQPCIRGTRVPVSMIVRLLGRGETLADVLEAYPSITAEDVRAAQDFAADYVENAAAIAAA